MTKICIWLLVLLLSFSLCACSQTAQVKPEEDSRGDPVAAPGERSLLECTVLQVYENSLLVYAKDEQDQYEIDLTNLQGNKKLSFAPGERIKVEYSAPEEEIYPVRITCVYGIEKLS